MLTLRHDEEVAVGDDLVIRPVITERGRGFMVNGIVVAYLATDIQSGRPMIRLSSRAPGVRMVRRRAEA